MTPGSGRLAAVRAALPALVVSAVAGVAGVAGSYAVAGFSPAFLVGPIAGFLARRLPAQVLTFAIVVLGDLGEQLNVVGAAGIAVGLLAVAALAGTAVGRRLEAPLVGAVLGGWAAGAVGRRLEAPLVGAVLGGWAAGAVAFAVSTTAATATPVVALAAAVAAGGAVAVVLAAATLAPSVARGTTSRGRRRVLGGLAGAAGLAVVGTALGRRGGLLGSPPAADVPLDVDATTAGQIADRLEEAAAKSLPVGGIEPLVSEEFYTVDINAIPPSIDPDEWTLAVTGAVEEEIAYGYDDVRAMEAENRFVTLRCVGEGLNGRKLDNALWTGVPIMDLVEPAGLPEECCVMLRAADDFYEEFPLPALADGFLAYGMNGDTLPGPHGYPARALIPGHWGEINVKWLTEIEVLERPADGYWEKRGWHGTGPVNTVAKLHHVGRLDDGRREVAGHAYAGTRGISRVEVSTDGGDSWSDAELSEPLPGTDVWRQWRYAYEPPGGRHEVVVRATDGEGKVQSATESGAFPSGPSGWVSRSVER